MRTRLALLTRKKVLVWLACAAGLLVSFGGLTVHFGSLSLWDTSTLVDETSFRNAAQLLGTGELYDPEAYAAIQRREYQATDSFRVFLRPPWYALATVWLKCLTPESSLVAWRILMGLATGLFVVLWARWEEAALAICWSVPLAVGIQQGQDDSVILASLGVALYCARGGKDFFAGLALAICSLKPNLFVFLPFVLIVTQRAKLLAGLVAGLTSLMVVSYIVQGAAWPGDFLNLLLTPVLYNSYPHGVSLAYLATTGLVAFNNVAVALLAVAGVVCACRIAKANGLEMGLSAALAAAVVTSPHAYLQDALLVLPFILLMFRASAGWKTALALGVLSSIWTIPFFYLTRDATGSVAAPLVIALPVSILLVAAMRSRLNDVAVSLIGPDARLAQ